MDINSLKSMAKKAAKDTCNSAVDTPRKQGFKVSFNSSEMLDLFLSIIPIEDPVIVCSPNCAWLGGLAPNEGMAKMTIDRIDAFKSEFNHLLMQEPYDPNWLSTHLKLKDFGIVEASVEQNTSTPEDLEIRFKNAKSMVDSMEDYRNTINGYRSQADKMSFNDVVEDLSDFIIHNCEGFGSESEIQTTVFELVKTLATKATDYDFLDTSHCLNLTALLSDYEDHLGESDDVEKMLARMKDHRKLLLLRDEIESKKDALASDMIQHADHLLATTFPDLGLKALNGIFVERLTKPFGGISTKETKPLGFQDQMDPNHVCYRIEEQGETFSRVLARAIVSYVYSLIQYQHEIRHERTLVEFSKRIDKESYVDNAVALIEQSRPTLYRGEQL